MGSNPNENFIGKWVEAKQGKLSKIINKFTFVRKFQFFLQEN